MTRISVTVHGSMSELLGGMGSRTGLKPRLTFELGGMGSRTGFAPRWTSDLGSLGSRTGFAPRLASELGGLGSRTGLKPRLTSELGGMGSRTGFAPRLAGFGAWSTGGRACAQMKRTTRKETTNVLQDSFVKFCFFVL